MENRLVSVTKGQHRSEFEYDPLGRRSRIIEKDSDGQGGWTTGSDKRYLWEGAEIVEEEAADGSTLKAFYGQGFVDTDGTALYYTRDHLGSVRELVDAQGAVRARYDYDPYGRVTKLSGDRDSLFLYTGHLWHQQSGLFLTPTRAYSPELGRWISRDPLGVQGGLNLYGYVFNDPINYWDPTGEFAALAIPLAPVIAPIIVPVLIIAAAVAVVIITDKLMDKLIDKIMPQAKAQDGADAVPDETPKSCPVDQTKPPRVTNPKHHPKSPSPEPDNVDDLYDKSQEAPDGTRWSEDENGDLHRFTRPDPSDGSTHWNGDTRGTPNNKPISPNDIPIFIKRFFKWKP